MFAAIFHCLLFLLRLYTTLMHGGNWSYLDYGESVVCMTWVRGG
jgi:hypothetical protein